MMVSQDIEKRLKDIQPPDWEKHIFLDWYGVDLWMENSDLHVFFETWSLNQLQKRDVFHASHVNRIAFELYLQANHLLPLSIAADQLAIPRGDIVSLLESMVDRKLLMNKPEWIQGVCAKNLPDELPGLLPSFPHRIFANAPSKIRAFHEAILRDLELEFEMVKVCPFEGDEQKPAYQRDILTCEPVALGDSVWMDFEKPVSLRPDVCSKKTYLQFRDILAPFLLGPEPEWAQPPAESYVAESAPDYA